jgi:hypothetical protein
MREIISQAGEAVCGLTIRTDSQVVRYPNRYMDEKGIEMWNLVVQLVHVLRRATNRRRPSDQ